MTQWYKKTQKQENRKKILNALSKETLTFQELLEKTRISRATLTAHSKELLKNEDIEKIYDDQRNRVVYRITKKALIEELILEKLIDYVGRLTVWRILDGALRKETEVHIEEYYKPENFLKGFIKTQFNRTDVETKAVLEAFEKKYKPEDLVI